MILLLCFALGFFAIIASVLFQGCSFGPDGRHDGSDERYAPIACNAITNFTTTTYPDGTAPAGGSSSSSGSGASGNVATATYGVGTYPLTYCSTWSQLCSDYFHDIGESIMKMFIVLTTVRSDVTLSTAASLASPRSRARHD